MSEEWVADQLEVSIPMLAAKASRPSSAYLAAVVQYNAYMSLSTEIQAL